MGEVVLDNLEHRVRNLHVNDQRSEAGARVAPGDCGCWECTETMDIIRAIDKQPRQHLLKLGDDGWSIEHPLACRLARGAMGETLHDCDVHQEAHEYLHTTKPRHLKDGTYELARIDNALAVRPDSDEEMGSDWVPLVEPHDPVSHSSRSPGT